MLVLHLVLSRASAQDVPVTANCAAQALPVSSAAGEMSANGEALAISALRLRSVSGGDAPRRGKKSQPDTPEAAAGVLIVPVSGDPVFAEIPVYADYDLQVAPVPEGFAVAGKVWGTLSLDGSFTARTQPLPASPPADLVVAPDGAWVTVNTLSLDRAEFSFPMRGELEPALSPADGMHATVEGGRRAFVDASTGHSVILGSATLLDSHTSTFASQVWTAAVTEFGQLVRGSARQFFALGPLRVLAADIQNGAVVALVATGSELLVYRFDDATRGVSLPAGADARSLAVVGGRVLVVGAFGGNAAVWELDSQLNATLIHQRSDGGVYRAAVAAGPGAALLLGRPDTSVSLVRLTVDAQCRP